jgi:hypothetical protein
VEWTGLKRRKSSLFRLAVHPHTMRLSNIFGIVVLGLASTSQAAKSWSFEDATVAVTAKGAAEAPSKEK